MFTAVLIGMFVFDTYIASMLGLYTVQTLLNWGLDTLIIILINVPFIFIAMYTMYSSFRNVLARFFKK